MSLGQPIRAPREPAPEWRPVPGKPWLERNARGQLRTKLPEPPAHSRPWPWPIGRP